MKDRTTYVYFIQAGYGAIKVGIAKNPEKRLANMQTGTSKKLRLIAAFPMPDRRSARTLEQDLHKKFAKERIRGEWFNRRIVRLGQMKNIFQGTLKEPELKPISRMPKPKERKNSLGIERKKAIRQLDMMHLADLIHKGFA